MISILMSPGRRISNPFVGMLLDSLPDSVVVQGFTWRRAFLRQYDILHVHWPDGLIGGRHWWIRLAGRMLLTIYLGFLRIRRTPVVWTVHNLEPHEVPGVWGQWLCQRLTSFAAARVYLSNAGRLEAHDSLGLVVKHGDYKPALRGFDPRRHRVRAGALLAFGLLRPYKGYEELMASVSVLANGGHGLSLLIAGPPVDHGYVQVLRERAIESQDCEVRVGRLGDRELAALIAESEVVVAPYRRVHNSGVVLMALTVGRPVIVTASPSMMELRDEVGPEWMALVQHPLTTEDLLKAVESLRTSNRSGAPSFDGRNWDQIGAAYERIYFNLAQDLED